jgi:hypothetical protein
VRINHPNIWLFEALQQMSNFSAPKKNLNYRAGSFRNNLGNEVMNND